MKSFFRKSDWLDRMSLRPLSHIRHNWELTWDDANDRYLHESDSYAELLNNLIDELGTVNPPAKYHDNEDRLAEYTRDHLGWPIRKVSGHWVGADYQSILEQGGFDDVSEKDLMLAAAGRIKAAQVRGQNHFNEMEEGHQSMLAAVLAIILYHRS